MSSGAHHYPYCATCRMSLCVTCAMGAHKEHCLLSKPSPPPFGCTGCRDALSLSHLHAAGVEETFSTNVTQALYRLQVLFLDAWRSGGQISPHCEVTGALPLDLAMGLLQRVPGEPYTEPSLPVLLRAVQRCPLFHCTRVSGSSASVSLHHPRAHELAALAAPHAAHLFGAQQQGVQPPSLSGRAAQALADCGLLPLTLQALAKGAVPLWSPTDSRAGAAAVSGGGGGEGCPPEFFLLPPPRLPRGEALSSPPPVPHLVPPPSAASPPAAAAVVPPVSRRLRTLPEIRAWAHGVLERLHALSSAHTLGPGAVLGAFAVSLFYCAPAESTGAPPRLGAVALACSLEGCGGPIVFELDEVAQWCTLDRRRREGGAGGSSSSAGGIGGGSEDFTPSVVTLLHPLLPVLLDPRLVKAVKTPASSTAVLAVEAGMHSVNVLALDFVAEELNGQDGATWQRAQSSCKPQGAAGSPWEAVGNQASDLLAQALAWLRLSSHVGGGGSSSSAGISSEAVHRVWLRSQLSGLAATSPAALAAAPFAPLAGSESLPAQAPSKKRHLEATAGRGSSPLITPPWYLECGGCRVASAGHYIVDCPAWLLSA